MIRALVCVLAILFAFAFYHRLRAARSGEWLNRTKEGWFLLIAIRLTGLAGFLSIYFALARPEWIGWSRVDLPDAVRWAGFALVAAAAMWLGWMFRALGENLTDTVVTRSNARLVTHGPYRYVRNPMYVGVLALLTGLGAAAGTWLLPLIGVAIFALLASRTSIEERFLIERFGDDYRDYMRRTGRFIPMTEPGGARG